MKFENVLKNLGRNPISDKNVNKFNLDLKEKIEKKEYKISGQGETQAVFFEGHGIIFFQKNGHNFHKKIEPILDDESKKMLSKISDNKDLIAKNFANDRDSKIEEIKKLYSTNISDCQSLKNEGSEGGKIRQNKGDMVEEISSMVCRIAIDDLNKEFNKTTIIRIKKDTVDIFHKNDRTVSYQMEIDRLVQIDGKTVGHIESKAYADLSMYKRALFDAYLATEHYPEIECFLFELEKGVADSSDSLKVLNSKFPEVVLHKHSLLNQLRSSSREIHDVCNYKELSSQEIEDAILFFKSKLRKFFL